MAGGAQDDDIFLTSSQWWIVGLYTTPHSIFMAPAVGDVAQSWLCKHAPSSRTGADGPQAEERAIAADAHRIARVRVTNFCFLFFSPRL